MISLKFFFLHFQSERRSVKVAFSLYIFDKRAGTMLTNGSEWKKAEFAQI